jgi:hypothetical protein
VNGATALPPRSGYDHIGLPAAAAGADEPGAPIEHRRCHAVSLGHLAAVGLNLMPAILAPNDQADLRSGGATQRHRRAGLRVHSFGARGSRRLGRVARVREEIQDPACTSKKSRDFDYEKSPVLMDRAFNKFTNAEQDTNINFASSKSMVDCSRRQCLMPPSLLVYP